MDLFAENSIPDAFAEWCASDPVGLTTVRLFGARVEEKAQVQNVFINPCNSVHPNTIVTGGAIA